MYTPWRTKDIHVCIPVSTLGYIHNTGGVLWANWASICRNKKKKQVKMPASSVPALNPRLTLTEVQPCSFFPSRQKEFVTQCKENYFSGEYLHPVTDIMTWEFHLQVHCNLSLSILQDFSMHLHCQLRKNPNDQAQPSKPLIFVSGREAKSRRCSAESRKLSNLRKRPAVVDAKFESGFASWFLRIVQFLLFLAVQVF